MEKEAKAKAQGRSEVIAEIRKKLPFNNTVPAKEYHYTKVGKQMLSEINAILDKLEKGSDMSKGKEDFLKEDFLKHDFFAIGYALRTNHYEIDKRVYDEVFHGKKIDTNVLFCYYYNQGWRKYDSLMLEIEAEKEAKKQHKPVMEHDDTKEYCQ